jgi:hypothetical protein
MCAMHRPKEWTVHLLLRWSYPQAAAARAAANVTAGLGKNLVSPKTSYEFEAVWKGLSGNRSSQAHLLKVPILPL